MLRDRSSRLWYSRPSSAQPSGSLSRLDRAVRVLHHRRNRILRALSELRLVESERSSLRVATASTSFLGASRGRRASGGSTSVGSVLASYKLARESYCARRGGAAYLGGPLPGSTLQTVPGATTVSSAEFESRVSRVESAFQAQINSISATLGVNVESKADDKVEGRSSSEIDNLNDSVSQKNRVEDSNEADFKPSSPTTRRDNDLNHSVSQKNRVEDSNETLLDATVARRLQELEARASEAEAAAAL